MKEFRFRKDEHKVLGAAGYSVNNDEIGSLQYTGLYHGDEIVALLVSEWNEGTTERMLALGDFIVRSCNSHAQLVAALKRFLSYGDVFAYRQRDGSPYEQALEALAAAGEQP